MSARRENFGVFYLWFLLDSQNKKYLTNIFRKLKYSVFLTSQVLK